MNANVSISVTPGSDTLWSVHSGQRRWTSRFASSTRSWKRRSSRFGTGRAMSVVASVFGGGVKGENGVALVVVRLDLIVDVDVELVALHRVDGDVDEFDVDARLPPLQRLVDLVRQLRRGVDRRRPEDVVAQFRAELRAHRPLARVRGEDQ